MAVSRPHNESPLRSDQVATLAKSLAPEDIHAGDYVTVLHVVHELFALAWCDDLALTERDEIIRLKLVPEKSGEPLLVKSVCLPFVLVKNLAGKKRPLDIRRSLLARLDPVYAEAAFSKKKSKRRKQKSKKKKR